MFEFKSTISQQISQILTPFKLIVNIFAEPVGSVAPKITFLERFKVNQIASGSSSAIFCPAQSYPVPIFRCVTVDARNKSFLKNAKHTFRQFYIVFNHVDYTKTIIYRWKYLFVNQNQLPAYVLRYNCRTNINLSMSNWVAIMRYSASRNPTQCQLLGTNV